MFFTNNALRWLETILQERFGHSFELVEQAQTLKLYLPGSPGSITFDQLQLVFHQSRSDFPCQHWQASAEGYQAPIEDSIPAPSDTELPIPLVEVNKQGALVHYDILGLTFWMLTRLEEVGRTDLDEHQRFPATSSHAYKHDYLERPIVDEWLIILGQVIERVWIGIDLKRQEFGVKVSHDVDSPSQYGFKPWSTIARMMAGHLIKRRDLKAFFLAPYIKLFTNSHLRSADPFNTFEWLMEVSESNNLKSAFYFICGRTDKGKDGDYELEHPVIRKLMRLIHERGHEIGLHPSYGTFQNAGLIAQEAERLKRVCAEEDIEQAQWGGRMHFLRWEQTVTMCACDSAGMNYDSTLGYADSVGFRCGTCYEFPGFDVIAQYELDIRIRPLIAMDCTILSRKYMGLKYHDTEKILKKLVARCKKVDGCFTLLWHNSFFEDKECFLVYEDVLKHALS